MELLVVISAAERQREARGLHMLAGKRPIVNHQLTLSRFHDLGVKISDHTSWTTLCVVAEEQSPLIHAMTFATIQDEEIYRYREDKKVEFQSVS
jgi:hypothetical protein